MNFAGTLYDHLDVSVERISFLFIFIIGLVWEAKRVSLLMAAMDMHRGRCALNSAC